MQHNDKKLLHFKKSLGRVLNKLRTSGTKISRSQFAREYDIDRGNLSKIENGKLSCSIITVWKIAEALGIKFSVFAKLLEEELGEDFTLIEQ